MGYQAGAYPDFCNMKTWNFSSLDNKKQLFSVKNGEGNHKGHSTTEKEENEAVQATNNNSVLEVFKSQNTGILQIKMARKWIFLVT